MHMYKYVDDVLLILSLLVVKGTRESDILVCKQFLIENVCQTAKKYKLSLVFVDYYSGIHQHLLLSYM